MNRRNIRTVTLFASVAIVLACAPISIAAPTVAPTLNPLSLEIIVAQTAGAAATQTAIFAPPTFTPIPSATNTPTEQPSPTPTFIFILPTITPTPRLNDPSAAGSSGEDLSCDVVTQVPSDNSEFAPRVVFTTRWQVRNTGNDSWRSDSTDYLYNSGDKLHTQSIYDLNRTVPPGNAIDIIVDMISPQNPGTYNTTWRLRIGRTQFCSMRLTIIVK